MDNDTDPVTVDIVRAFAYNTLLLAIEAKASASVLDHLMDVLRELGAQESELRYALVRP